MHNFELLAFLLMGVLIMVAQVNLNKKLKEIGKAKIWSNQILSVGAIVLIAFGVLWAVSSLLEHETQAAMMGIIIFSGSGVLLGLIAFRLISRQS
jgi:hypothetical protein